MNFVSKSLKSILLAGSLLLGTANMQAQNAQDSIFSLKKCIEYGLTNHASKAIYANNVEMAQQQGRQALAGYLPQVGVSGSFDDNLKRQVTIIPAGTFSPVDLKVQFGNKYSTNIYADASQTIYDQSLINGLKANKPNERIAVLKEQQNDENIEYTIATAYYQVLTFKEQLRLLEQNEKKLANLSSILKLQYEKGVAKKVDYDRVRVSYNSVLIQKKTAQTNYELALNQLKNTMGMPLGNPLAIASDSLSANDALLAMPGAVSLNAAQTLDYQIMQQSLKLQEIDVNVKKATFLPSLSAYGRYGVQSFGNDLGKSLDNWFDYSMVGLRLSAPIFSGMRKSSILQQSILNLSTAKANLELNTNNLNLQLLNTYTQLNSSYNNLQSAQANLDLAKEVFDVTSLQYEKGTASPTDLLNAEYSYKEAQANYINSLYSYLTARISYEKSNGTLQQYIKQL